MIREKLNWNAQESESTEAKHRGGTTRSSEEVSVMGMERRGRIVQRNSKVNWRNWDEPKESSKFIRTIRAV
jgi:hypothetical protein